MRQFSSKMSSYNYKNYIQKKKITDQSLSVGRFEQPENSQSTTRAQCVLLASTPDRYSNFLQRYLKKFYSALSKVPELPPYKLRLFISTFGVKIIYRSFSLHKLLWSSLTPLTRRSNVPANPYSETNVLIINLL